MEATKQTVSISGVQLVRLGEYSCVLVEIDGRWVEVIREFHDVFYSHIVEPSGILKAAMEVPQ